MRRLLFVLMVFVALGASAQRIGIKTNALQWAACTQNVGAEFVVGRHISLNIEAARNRLDVSRVNLSHTSLMPEVRIWTQRPMARHFVGVVAGIAKYDTRLGDTYRNGNALMAGLTYGYDFVLGKHWNLELTAGAGYARCKQIRYKTGEAKPKERTPKNAFTPLKLGVSFIYII